MGVSGVELRLCGTGEGSGGGVVLLRVVVGSVEFEFVVMSV